MQQTAQASAGEMCKGNIFGEKLISLCRVDLGLIIRSGGNFVHHKIQSFHDRIFNFIFKLDHFLFGQLVFGNHLLFLVHSS